MATNARQKVAIEALRPIVAGLEARLEAVLGQPATEEAVQALGPHLVSVHAMAHEIWPAVKAMRELDAILRAKGE